MEAFDIIRKTMKEFDGVDDDTVNVHITLVKPLISKKKFGNLYEQALAYLAAHRMKLAGLGEDTGAGSPGNTYGIASVSEGGASISFNSSYQSYGTADSEYALTVYGCQFLALRSRVIVPITARGGVCDG